MKVKLSRLCLEGLGVEQICPPLYLSLRFRWRWVIKVTLRQHPGTHWSCGWIVCGQSRAGLDVIGGEKVSDVWSSTLYSSEFFLPVLNNLFIRDLGHEQWARQVLQFYRDCLTTTTTISIITTTQWIIIIIIKRGMRDVSSSEQGSITGIAVALLCQVFK